MDFRYFSGFLLLIIVSTGTAQDPRFVDHIPEQCGGSTNFCLTYCLSIEPGTIRARCGRDKVSCICSNKNNQSVRVRFVQERRPAPLTTTTTPIPDTVPTPTFDYPPQDPVPIMLECDGTYDATAICNDFCQMDIGASRGKCDLADRTCLCEGVSPAIVQAAPIPAIFFPRQVPPTQPPPTTPQPSVIQQSYWTPITPDHPNFNHHYQYNPNDYIHNDHNLQHMLPLGQVQPLQHGPLPQFYAPQPQLYPNIPSQQLPSTPQHHNLHTTYIYPYVGPGNPDPNIQMHTYHDTIQYPDNQGAIPNVAHVPEPVPEAQNTSAETTPEPQKPIETTTFPTIQKAQPKAGLENHRQRRSAGSSYANGLRYGSSSSTHLESSSRCSTSSCQDACNESGFDGTKCTPTCIEFTCACICKPEMTQDMIDNHGALGSEGFDIGGVGTSSESESAYDSSSSSGGGGSFTSTSFNNKLPMSIGTSSIGSGGTGFTGFGTEKHYQNPVFAMSKFPMPGMSQEEVLNLFKPPPTLF